MRLAKHVKFREEKFGGVLFETRSEKVYTLTPTAAAVVKQVSQGKAAAEIAPAMVETFDADGATIERDVKAFLSELAEKGLVED